MHEHHDAWVESQWKVWQRKCIHRSSASVFVVRACMLMCLHLQQAARLDTGRHTHTQHVVFTNRALCVGRVA